MKTYYKKSLIEVDKLQLFIENNRHKDLRIVFDMGSKASRMLVAPVITEADLKDWDPFNWFHIESRTFELLRDRGRYSGNIKKAALDKTIDFINDIKQKFDGIVAKENYTLVGTEVYRVANNQEEILSEILTRTGFTVTILDKEAEAFLSLIALTHTYTRPSNKMVIPPMEPDDIILLFDQGGGSTEISYYELGLEEFGEQCSISEVGTNALRNLFFTYYQGDRIDPERNASRISTQFDRIDELVNEKIDAEFDKRDELKRISGLSKKLHAFAMGTSVLEALTKETGDYGKKLHCRSISTVALNKVMKDSCFSLEDSKKQVKTLWGILTRNPDEVAEEDRNNFVVSQKKLESELLLLYGLPAYIKLLEKFELDEIRYSHFNLKHGVFILRNFYGIKDVNIKSLPCESKTALFDSRFDWDDYAEKGEYIGMAKFDFSSIRPDAKKILILTAIQEEFDKLSSFFGPLTEEGEVSDEDTNIVLYKVNPKDPFNFRFYIGVTGQGNTEADFITGAAIRKINPDYCVFVGTAGSTGKQNVGDVIVAQKVYDIDDGWDGVRYNKKISTNSEQSSQKCLNAARGAFPTSEKLNTFLKNRSTKNFENDCVIRLGNIGTSNKVIMSINSHSMNIITEHFADENLLAVEKEGKGFLHACKQLSKNGMIIRGISDMLDGKEEANRKGSKQLATENACKVAFEIIKRLN